MRVICLVAALYVQPETERTTTQERKAKARAALLAVAAPLVGKERERRMAEEWGWKKEGSNKCRGKGVNDRGRNS